MYMYFAALNCIIMFQLTNFEFQLCLSIPISSISINEYLDLTLTYTSMVVQSESLRTDTLVAAGCVNTDLHIYGSSVWIL